MCLSARKAPTVLPLSHKRLCRGRNSFLVRRVAVNRKAPPSKMQTTTCKRAACGLAVPPYQRAKPIYLPSHATDASRGRPPAFFETLARPSTLRASRLRIPRKLNSQSIGCPPVTWGGALESALSSLGISKEIGEWVDVNSLQFMG